MILLSEIGFPTYITLVILFSGVLFALFWLAIILLFCRLKGKQGKLKRQPAFLAQTREVVPTAEPKSRKYDNKEYSSIDMESSGVHTAMEMAAIRSQERREMLEEERSKRSLVSSQSVVTCFAQTNPIINLPQQTEEPSAVASESQPQAALKNGILKRGSTNGQAAQRKMSDRAANQSAGLNTMGLIDIVPMTPTITPMTFVTKAQPKYPNVSGLSDIAEDDSTLSSASTDTLGPKFIYNKTSTSLLAHQIPFHDNQYSTSPSNTNETSTKNTLPKSVDMKNGEPPHIPDQDIYCSIVVTSSNGRRDISIANDFISVPPTIPLPPHPKIESKTATSDTLNNGQSEADDSLPKKSINNDEGENVFTPHKTISAPVSTSSLPNHESTGKIFPDITATI